MLNISLRYPKDYDDNEIWYNADGTISSDNSATNPHKYKWFDNRTVLTYLRAGKWNQSGYTSYVQFNDFSKAWWKSVPAYCAYTKDTNVIYNHFKPYMVSNNDSLFEINVNDITYVAIISPFIQDFHNNRRDIGFKLYVCPKDIYSSDSQIGFCVFQMKDYPSLRWATTVEPLTEERFVMYSSEQGAYVNGFNSSLSFSRAKSIFDSIISVNKTTIENASKDTIKYISPNNIDNITEVFISTSAYTNRTFYLTTTFQSSYNEETNSNVVNYVTQLFKHILEDILYIEATSRVARFILPNLREDPYGSSHL